MRNCLGVLLLTTLLITFLTVTHAYAMRADSSAYQEPTYDILAKYLMSTKKRSCIRRGGSCDHRPSDCCFSSSCRCNLWGTNCRCQRMGLFQKWGK
ncbi:toxin Tbo-IT2-like isoform X3 [Argiope bruennichi]|uniref:U8-agatoxin-Ao1a n=1 Tax=Larinioides sclopetarius TaxID=280406 RepID=A0AAV2A8E3_9ARAC|nr:toxin Tbo-IT2-like isoform X3 [Argiope bruennichi]